MKKTWSVELNEKVKVYSWKDFEKLTKVEKVSKYWVEKTLKKTWSVELNEKVKVSRSVIK